MVERLFKLGFLTRREDAADRRRKQLAVTPAAERMLDRLVRARAAEYAKGTATLSPALRRELAAALAKAVRELS
jgi:DNA-binding MarR family transcriptional regulator